MVDREFEGHFERNDDGGWVVPIIVSLLLHGSLVALLLLVMPREEARVIKPPPSYVAARIVTIEPPKTPARIPPKSIPAKEVKPVEPKPDKAAIALKRKQEEERKKAEQKRQQELKKKREQELARQKELEQLKRQRAEELRKKRERERVLKQQEQELQTALAREAEQAAEDAGIVAGYAALIQRVVESEWSRPASARRGMKTTLRIQLLPSGQLISVQILSGSGNEAFDRSAVLAVERAAPFTELQDMEARLFDKNFRTLRFVFNPEDLLK